jgi:hypothetical protein
LLLQVAPEAVKKSSSRLKMKHVLIGVLPLLALGLVVTCVLVAVRISSDEQEDIVKVS